MTDPNFFTCPCCGAKCDADRRSCRSCGLMNARYLQADDLDEEYEEALAADLTPYFWGKDDDSLLRLDHARDMGCRTLEELREQERQDANIWEEDDAA